jgi:hypothetical protein
MRDNNRACFIMKRQRHLSIIVEADSGRPRAFHPSSVADFSIMRHRPTLRRCVICVTGAFKHPRIKFLALQERPPPVLVRVAFKLPLLALLSLPPPLSLSLSLSFFLGGNPDPQGRDPVPALRANAPLFHGAIASLPSSFPRNARFLPVTGMN